MRRDKIIYYSIIMLLGVVAITPIGLAFIPLTSSFVDLKLMTGINLLAWVVVLMLYVARQDFNERVIKSSKAFGIDVRFKTLDNLVQELLHEIQRRNESFSTSLFEKKLNSKDELPVTLEKIVAKAYRLLAADSSELALYDQESGLYHSAFVLGNPFKTSAQAMLAGAKGEEEKDISPDVLVQPIAFSGNVLGTLRVKLADGRLPTVGDREVITLLALQGGLALLNAQYTDTLLEMKQSSDESIKAKTGFLANLSHEIRGPLGIILNAVELVLDGLCGPVSTDQLDTLRMVHSNGQHLLELINDVLDYAKVESGKLTPNKVQILVQDLLEDICGVVRSQADSKSHRLICRPNSDLLAFNCDRRHIRQMMINLLTNAIKYTPDGGQIEVWAERMPGNKIKINVKDSGIGIKPQDRSKVFAAFERIENSYSINQVGTGLGMPLTKRLAEVNAGSINFDSNFGQGSHFWLIFDASEIKQTPKLEADEEQISVVGKSELFLLVARDDGERAMLARYLTHLGFKIHCASTRIDALELLRSANVELVILDNNVTDAPDDKPEDNMVQVIRAHCRSSIPLVLLSSRAFVFDIEKYLKFGIDRYLAKPIKLKELAIVCRQLIDGTYSGAIVDEHEATEKKSAHSTSTKIVTDGIVH